METDEILNQLKIACKLVKGEWSEGALWCETTKLIISLEPRRAEVRIKDKKKELDIAINNKDIGIIETNENCIRFKAPSEQGKFPNVCNICVGTVYDPNKAVIECGGMGERILPINLKIIK